MKVILLDSPSWRLWNPRLHVSLALIYLAGSLRAAGHNVQILDCHELTSWDGQRLTIHEDRLEPCDVLGISATTANVYWGSELATVWKGARIKILGGPHVTHILRGSHQRFKQAKYFRGFDYLMVGEAEHSLVRFCDQLDRRSPCVGIPGLAFNDSQQIYGPYAEPETPEITALSAPAFDLWPSFSRGALSVTSFVGKQVDADKRRSSSICTSRGCPYGCLFCADARTRVRLETLGQITRQVKQLAELGVSAVRIQDDTFTIHEQRAKDIADILYDHGMIWRAMTRVNLTNPAFFEYMARKGCTELGFGIEHGSARMLRAMGKGTTPEANARSIRDCQDAGIVAHAFLIIGFPGETLETVEEMRTWIQSVKPESCTLSLFQPYPGCDVWNRPEVYGVKISDGDFERYWEVGRDDDPEIVVCEIPTMTRRQLFDARCEMAEWVDQNIAPLDRMVRKQESLCAVSAS